MANYPGEKTLLLILRSQHLEQNIQNKRMLQGVSGILTILVKLAYDGLVLGSTQFLLLPQLSQKMMFASKVVKNDSKIIILLCFVNLNLRHTAYI